MLKRKFWVMESFIVLTLRPILLKPLQQGTSSNKQGSDILSSEAKEHTRDQIDNAEQHQAKLKSTIFWDTTPFGLLKVGGIPRRHLHCRRISRAR
jgi:hypothetical protein